MRQEPVLSALNSLFHLMNQKYFKASNLEMRIISEGSEEIKQMR